MTAPLLRCDRPAFAGHDLELGQFEADAARLVLVGAWSPLFGLFAGEVPLTSGSVQVAGENAERLAGTRSLGLLLQGAPLPPTWTLREVLVESGRLLGLSRREASQHGEHLAQSFGLGDRLPRRLQALPLVEQRAAALVMASLGEPPVLALENPFAGLEPSGQAYIAALVARALAGRKGLVSLAELVGSVEQDAFLQGADEILVLGVGGLVARGSYATLLGSVGRYRVVVARKADALLARLEQAGYQVTLVTAAAVTALMVQDAAHAGTNGILDAALAADAPILELVPAGAGAPERE